MKKSQENQKPTEPTLTQKQIREKCGKEIQEVLDKYGCSLECEIDDIVLMTALIRAIKSVPKTINIS